MNDYIFSANIENGAEINVLKPFYTDEPATISVHFSWGDDWQKDADKTTVLIALLHEAVEAARIYDRANLQVSL